MDLPAAVTALGRLARRSGAGRVHRVGRRPDGSEICDRGGTDRLLDRAVLFAARLSLPTPHATDQVSDVDAALGRLVPVLVDDGLRVDCCVDERATRGQRRNSRVVGAVRPVAVRQLRGDVRALTAADVAQSRAIWRGDGCRRRGVANTGSGGPRRDHQSDCRRLVVRIFRLHAQHLRGGSLHGDTPDDGCVGRVLLQPSAAEHLYRVDGSGPVGAVAGRRVIAGAGARRGHLRGDGRAADVAFSRCRRLARQSARRSANAAGSQRLARPGGSAARRARRPSLVSQSRVRRAEHGGNRRTAGGRLEFRRRIPGTAASFRVVFPRGHRLAAGGTNLWPWSGGRAALRIYDRRVCRTDYRLG